MIPPVPVWPDGAAITFHYTDLSVFYLKHPVTGVVTPIDRVPVLGANKVVLWIGQQPLLEVKVDHKNQIAFISRVESDKSGFAKYYLVGWKQMIRNDLWFYCYACYVPPNSSTPGRIIVESGNRLPIIDSFLDPTLERAPANCWPDSTSYTFHYRDGKRRDRISMEDGEELTSEKMPRAGLQKITLWHHELPVVTQHYTIGQRALFRRRNEYRDNVATMIGGEGIPLEGLMASTNWFNFKKAEAENKYRALYMLGCRQSLNNQEMQIVTYYHPQNGQIPPRVVLAGRFKEDGDSYLPLPVGFDDNVIT